MKYLISIIMPIYNAEKNLKRAIESIINQSIGFENIELILIDDNSTDQSKSIIKEYSNKYENVISIFLEKNSGWASVPRNEGIKYATAENIMFIDSDDEYDVNICKKFYKNIQKENVDLVSCNYISKDNISQTKIKVNFNDTNNHNDNILISNEDILKFDNIFVWNKIFKKKIIDDEKLFFKENASEDFIFCMEYLLNSKNRIYLSNFYGYIKNSQTNSLSSNNSNLQTISSLIDSDKYVADLIRKYIKNPIHLKQLYNHIFKTSLSCRIEEIITLNNDEYRKGLKELYLFEKQIQFESNLNNSFITFINKLILGKKCCLLIVILRLSKFLFNLKISRKIYRIVVNNSN